jgi:hypothetical protein
MFHTRSSRALSGRRCYRTRTRRSRSVCCLRSSGCFRCLFRRLLSCSCSTSGSTKGRSPRWHSSTRPCTWRWCRIGLDQLHIKVLVLGFLREELKMKGSVTYGACIIRISQGRSQAFPIAESQSNIVRCAAPNECVNVEIPAWICAGSSSG